MIMVISFASSSSALQIMFVYSYRLLPISYDYLGFGVSYCLSYS